MSLWFKLRAEMVNLGIVEIRRTRHLDLADKTAIADEVSDYEVTVGDRKLGTVSHRYGDGAWTLLRKAAELIEKGSRNT